MFGVYMIDYNFRIFYCDMKEIIITIYYNNIRISYLLRIFDIKLEI